jgi:hypothetical protein
MKSIAKHHHIPLDCSKDAHVSTYLLDRGEHTPDEIDVLKSTKEVYDSLVNLKVTFAGRLTGNDTVPAGSIVVPSCIHPVFIEGHKMYSPFIVVNSTRLKSRAKFYVLSPLFGQGAILYIQGLSLAKPNKHINVR